MTKIELTKAYIYVLQHSPMLRTISEKDGKSVAKNKLLGLPPDKLIQIYQDLMAQVHLGAISKADEPNETVDISTIDPLYFDIFLTKEEN